MNVHSKNILLTIEEHNYTYKYTFINNNFVFFSYFIYDFGLLLFY